MSAEELIAEMKALVEQCRTLLGTLNKQPAPKADKPFWVDDACHQLLTMSSKPLDGNKLDLVEKAKKYPQMSAAQVKFLSVIYKEHFDKWPDAVFGETVKEPADLESIPF